MQRKDMNMKVREIKTIKGKNPMRETFDFSFSNESGREHALINIFPDIEYQEIKGF